MSDFTAEQGSTEAVFTDTSTPATPSAGIVIYCTLPLQIGLNSNGGLATTRIDWKQFMTSPMLVLTLMGDNGVPINLTGALSVRLRLTPFLGGGVGIVAAMQVLYAAGGVVGYKFLAVDVATPGTFTLEVEAVQADGSAMYFPTMGRVVFALNSSLGGP